MFNSNIRHIGLLHLFGDTAGWAYRSGVDCTSSDKIVFKSHVSNLIYHVLVPDECHKRKRKRIGRGEIQTHVAKEICVLNQRLRPLGHLSIGRNWLNASFIKNLVTVKFCMLS